MTLISGTGSRCFTMTGMKHDSLATCRWAPASTSTLELHPQMLVWYQPQLYFAIVLPHCGTIVSLLQWNSNSALLRLSGKTSAFTLPYTKNFRSLLAASMCCTPRSLYTPQTPIRRLAQISPRLPTLPYSCDRIPRPHPHLHPLSSQLTNPFRTLPNRHSKKKMRDAVYHHPLICTTAEKKKGPAAKSRTSFLLRYLPMCPKVNRRNLPDTY